MVASIYFRAFPARLPSCSHRPVATTIRRRYPSCFGIYDCRCMSSDVCNSMHHFSLLLILSWKPFEEHFCCYLLISLILKNPFIFFWSIASFSLTLHLSLSASWRRRWSSSSWTLHSSLAFDISFSFLSLNKRKLNAHFISCSKKLLKIYHRFNIENRWKIFECLYLLLVHVIHLFNHTHDKITKWICGKRFSCYRC